MKKLLFLLCFISSTCFSQCIDTCFYTSVFKHNYDTSKYVQADKGFFGERTETTNRVTETTTIFHNESNNAMISLQSYYPGGQNILQTDKNGVEFISGKEFKISGQPIKFIAGTYSNVTIKEVGQNTVIIVPNFPTTCSGQVPGTIYNSSGALKVCP